MSALRRRGDRTELVMMTTPYRGSLALRRHGARALLCGVYVALLGLSACASRQGSGKTPDMITQGSPPSGARWARRRLAYSALSYEMPAEPQVSRTVHEHGESNEAEFSAAGGGVAFMVETFPHDSTELADAGHLLTAAVSAFVQRTGGVVQSREAVTVDGYPGEDVRCIFPAMGATARMRVLVGRFEAYVALATMHVNMGPDILADIDRFIGSLHVDAGDAPEADGDGALSPQVRYVEPVGAFFALRMPGAPRRERQTATTPNGERPTATYTVESPSHDEQWQVRVSLFEHRPPPSVFADTLRDLGAHGWTLRESRATSLQGYTGREATLTSADGRSTLRVQLFATESRLYDVRAVVPTASAGARSEQIAAYFSSMRIL